MYVFFDLDDTLVDHNSAVRVAALELRESYAVLRQLSPEAFLALWQQLADEQVTRYLAGELDFQEQRRRRIQNLFARWEEDLTTAEADRRFATYVARMEAAWHLFPDVLPTLDELGAQAVGVVTNGNPEQQRDKLERTGILQRFRCLITAEELGCAKPDPAPFLVACQRVGLAPSDCAYVGDNLNVDALGAQAAGLFGVWLNRSSSASDERVATIHSLQELSTALANGAGRYSEGERE